MIDVEGPVSDLIRAIAPLDVQRILSNEQALEDVFFNFLP